MKTIKIKISDFPYTLNGFTILTAQKGDMIDVPANIADDAIDRGRADLITGNKVEAAIADEVVEAPLETKPDVELESKPIRKKLGKKKSK